MEPSGTSPPWIRARVRLENTGRDPAHVAIGDLSCNIMVNAYVIRSGAPALVGSSALRGGGPPRACHAVRQPIDLAPGGVRTVEGRYLQRRVLADTLPGGRYLFTVNVQFLQPALTTPEILAGAATVRR
jgi:hypothetical protein